VAGHSGSGTDAAKQAATYFRQLHVSLYATVDEEESYVSLVLLVVL
jgi:hypothetical protein